MGKKYKEAVAIVTAQYNAIWRLAEAEEEKYGEISQATFDKLAGIELEMELLGI